MIDGATQPDGTMRQPRSGPKVVLSPSITFIARLNYAVPAVQILRSADQGVDNRAATLRGLGFRGFHRGSVLVDAPGVTIEDALFADQVAHNDNGADWVVHSTADGGTALTVRGISTAAFTSSIIFGPSSLWFPQPHGLKA